MKRLFGILVNAVYWMVILCMGFCLARWLNGKPLDFDVAKRVSGLFVFFLGFLVGSYKGNSSPAPLKAARHFLKGWRALRQSCRPIG